MRMERLTNLSAIAFFIFLISVSAVFLNATNEGTLIVTPSEELKPGDSLRFSATFNNTVGYPEGDTGHLMVTQEVGGQWISDFSRITMPGKDQLLKGVVA
ncbi:MAG: hypothetical protein A2Y62_20745 [Candidatus Fischerbacteria bacterium RBG_13_37_8]|uniref:Uncharacterized protein n=1 Tax=Candidatus Fischerbacteria bacterium RBG_13_37_8 TaxID=1817863 RepID=A0A1F5VXQ1_9BACT|nr:MAG: hypothetical protein A2Y62_20745 [Candidatus Fischerbacteria bacterium RBG_13_37_8]